MGVKIFSDLVPHNCKSASCTHCDVLMFRNFRATRNFLANYLYCVAGLRIMAPASVCRRHDVTRLPLALPARRGNTCCYARQSSEHSKLPETAAAPVATSFPTFVYQDLIQYNGQNKQLVSYRLVTSLTSISTSRTQKTELHHFLYVAFS